MESLPVVDFCQADRRKKVKQVVEAMETVGFLFLVNVPGYDESVLEKQVDWFYSLPLEKKMTLARRKYNPTSKNLFRGYFAADKVGSSFKEAFEFGKNLPVGHPALKTSFPITEDSVWPQPDEGEDPQPYTEFGETLTNFYDIFTDAAREIIRLIAIGLKLGESFFDPLFLPQSQSTYRLINYPVHNFEPPTSAYTKEGDLVSTEEHTDSSLLTLLSTFDYEGLEVLREDGSWLKVIPRYNSLVVNLGVLISKMTGNKVKATRHRVKAIGRSRRSVPFFFEPSCHAMVPRSIPEDRTIKSVEDCPDTFEYGKWMIDRMQMFIEYKDFLKCVTAEEEQLLKENSVLVS